MPADRTGRYNTHMHGELVTLGAMVLAGLGVCAAAVGQTKRYDFGELTADVQQFLSRNPSVKGATLYLAQEGHVIYRQNFGEYTDSTQAPIASGSKLLGAIAVMRLVDAGKMSLDDRVAAYVPAFARGMENNVTIRQCLAHTSGMPRSHPALRNHSITLAEAADRIATSWPVLLRAAPGTQFAYGGVSFQVAGHAAEVAAGKPWAQLFADEVATPLGMTDTDFNGLATSENPLIGGGAQSTVDDYAAVLQMLLDRGLHNGRRFLSEKAVEEILADQTGSAVITYTPQPDARRYGLGLWLDEVDPLDGRVVQASCQGAFGFSPWIDTDRRLVGIFLVRSHYLTVQPAVARWQQKIRHILDGG